MNLNLQLDRVGGGTNPKNLRLKLCVDGALEDRIFIGKEDLLWLLNQDDQPLSLLDTAQD